MYVVLARSDPAWSFSEQRMKRRDLLRNMTLLPLLSDGLAIPAAAVGSSQPDACLARRRTRPSDAAWPSQAAWKRLNDEVGGNLLPVHSPFDELMSARDSATAERLLKELADEL